jgi:hypothetical protein
LAPERVERTPAYSYGLIGAPTPVFKGVSGKPIGLGDYVSAGRLYQNTGRAVAKTSDTPQGGWWNAEVATGTQPAAELMDFARKWEEPQVAEAAAAREGLPPLAPTLGYAGKEQLAPRWKEMVKNFKDWYAGQKTPVRPGDEITPYRLRPDRPEVLAPEERAVRQAADPGIELTPGYGLSQEERASVANMLRSYPSGSKYNRREQMAQTDEALAWTKPGLALFTPPEQTLFNSVIDRYDELRRTYSSEGALKILEDEAPEAAPLIERAINAGFIIARKSTNPAEKTAHEGEVPMTPQAFVDGYREKTALGPADLREALKEKLNTGLAEHPYATKGIIGAAVGAPLMATLNQLGPETEKEKGAGRKNRIKRALEGALGGLVGGAAFGVASEAGGAVGKAGAKALLNG